MNWTEEEYDEYIKKRKSEALTALKKHEEHEKSEETDQIIVECVIPLPPVTKKNHGQIVTIGKRCPTCNKGKTTLMLPSKQYKEYESAIRKYLVPLQKQIGTISCPINLKCVFYTKTRRQSDLVGHLQSIQDLLTHYKVITDDCRDIVATTDGSKVLYDKETPRTEITITKLKNYEQWGKPKENG